MAVVKKLEVGGQVDNNALSNELRTQLDAFGLKAKDEIKVQNALVKFRDYFKDSTGKSFSEDPLTKQYTVSGQGSEIFAGSPDEIHRGWLTGNLKIQNDQDAMSVAAAIYSKAMNNMKDKTGVGMGGSTTGTKEAINIGDLGEFVISDIYGTKDNFKTQFGTIKTDDERKAKIYDFAQQKIADYLKKADANKDRFDYQDIQNVKNIQDAINNKDWTAFQSATNKVKWEPDKFLLSDEAKKQLEIDTKAATATKAKESFDKLGIAPDMQQKLYATGFTEVAPETWTPDANAGWFKDVLKQHGAHVFYNPTTKRHVAATKNGYFDYGMTDNFQPSYGYSWKNDETGFHWYNPQQHASNAGVWGADKYAGQNIGRELVTNMPGKVYGWSDEQDGTYSKDLLGKRDFTKKLVVIQNGIKKYLTRGDDHLYRDNQGRTVNVQIKGYGNTASVPQTYDIPEQFKALGADEELTFDLVYPKATEIMGILESTVGGNSPEYNAGDLKDVIKTLNLIATTSTKNDEKVKALKTLTAIQNLMGKANVKLKEGGIIKAASGAKLDQYLNKYGTPSTPVATAPKGPGTLINIEGTWKGNDWETNTAEAISAAGMAGSFIPGYGAIGGLVSTAADLYKDIHNDASGGDIAKDLAINLGFTALAFFGLGGLKALKIGAEAAKVGELAKVANSLKFESLAGKVIKLEKTGANPLVGKVKNLLETSEALGKESKSVLSGLADVSHVKEFEAITDAQKSILQAKGYLDAEGNVLKSLKEDIISSHSLQKSAATLPGRVGYGTVDLAKNTINHVNTLFGNDVARKVAKTIVTGGVAAAGINSAASIVTDAMGAPEGAGFLGSLAYTKPEDFKGALMLGAMSHGAIQNRLTAKALERQATRTTTEGASTFKIGDEEVTVKGLFSKAKNASTLGTELPLAGEKLKARSVIKNEASASKLKDELAAAYKETHGSELTSEQIAKINIDNIKITPGEIKSGYILGKEVQGTSGDPFRDVRDYQRAEKALTSGKSRPFSGLRSKSSNAIVKGEAPESGQVFKALKEHTVLTEEQLKQQAVEAAAKAKATKKELAKIVRSNKAEEIKKAKALANKKKALNKDWEDYENNVYENKKGGILKYKDGDKVLQLGYLDPTSLEIEAKNEGYLNYNPMSKTAGMFDNKGQYTKEFLERRKLITPEWLKKNQGEIQKRIDASGAKFILKSGNEGVQQLLKGTSDFKPGILHDIIMDVSQPMSDSRETPERLPIPGAAIPIDATQIKMPKLSDIPAPHITTGGGSGIDIKKKFDGINWSGLKKYLPDVTDLSNIAMYAGTVGTNAKVGNEQRQAVSEGMYTLPYLQNQYVRIDSPYTLQGEKQAGVMQSKAQRIANSTADIDKGMGARLTGATQANAIKEKAQAADQQRQDQLRGIQLQSNAKVSEANTKTLGQNRALSSQAFSKIHLINANQDLANNTALNNLITATNKNIPAKEYKQNQSDLYKAITNKDYTNAVDEYTKLNTTEGQAGEKAQYDLDVKNAGYKTPWEESTHYKRWQDAVTQSKGRVDLKRKPIDDLMMAQRFQQFLLKSGGSLSKQDKIDINRDKEDSVMRVKELELSYKSIMHNNEMLQKSLIKVFK